MDQLPAEVLLHVLSFLAPPDIAKLQIVSKRISRVAHDSFFWKRRCFRESAYLVNYARRNARRTSEADNQQQATLSQTIAVNANTFSTLNQLSPSSPVTPFSFERELPKKLERLQANWDPEFSNERIAWYDEYIHRHGEIAINWLQQPRSREITHDEVRGVALYRPDGNARLDCANETVLAVSPIDNGSVCIWDVRGTCVKKGSILAQSAPGILSDNRTKTRRVDSGVIESVAVDSARHRAFFAVQSRLIEVDLQTLSVVNCESFKFSITTISEANPRVPLTVGTSLAVHLLDYRARAHDRHDLVSGIDDFDRQRATLLYGRGLQDLFTNNLPPPMLSSSHPGPLSILHLRKGLDADVTDDIYVAGRFSNILHYDRRKFTSIQDSIHSGARICSLTALPYPFSTVVSELRRKGQLSTEQIEKSKNAKGNTLIACGEYGTKGSLELYGLSRPYGSGVLQDSIFKNRQTAAPSKLLSVVNHGTRIAFSDGNGFIKWFERDGFTEVRRCCIGQSDRHPVTSIFTSMPRSDEIARKLLPTGDGYARFGFGDLGRERVDNDLLFWTGEKLGTVSFSTKPGSTIEDFEDKMGLLSEEELWQMQRQDQYDRAMWETLKSSADAARIAQRLF